MPKSPHTPEFRAMVAQEYINGDGSFYYLSDKYHVGRATIQKWVALYRAHGIEAFITSNGNKSHSKDFKIFCVEAVLSGEGSSVDIAAKNNIHPTILESWIKMYNANRELKDYCPKREVYMAEARRKTTIDERKEIVNYCINHNRDYKTTASTYDVSYSQVYSWVKKYDAVGEDGLLDKRGHHKTDDEVDELERLRRENLRLKRKLQESEMANQLLKKVREFEGM
jgi:transposase-like protein